MTTKRDHQHRAAIQQRLAEVTFEIAEFVETHGMASQFTTLGPITNTGMVAW